jgi:hypothetical protein
MKTRGQFILFSSAADFTTWLRAAPIKRKIVRIQNHHTYEPSYNDFTGSNHFERLEAMRRYHTKERGWSDIGQTLTTFPDGAVAVCRAFEVAPACITGANSGAVCIEHLGNFDKGGDTMRPEHRACIVEVNAALASKFGVAVDTTGIVYHHWFDLKTGKRTDGKGTTKTCPGSAFFGGNAVEDCEKSFLPLVRAALGAPVVGERRWSDYFRKHVVLARYESDAVWWFKVEAPNSRELRAQTPWSQMPPERT